MSSVVVITHNVTADSAHKHSEVADVTDDGGKPTPTLNATIVETQTAASMLLVGCLQHGCLAYCKQESTDATNTN